ncbi:MAG: N-acetyltransferase family protein [Candidatus Binatia bacterium]
MHTEIRLLTPDDTDALVRLRREALESEPLAFSASLEDDRGLDADFVRQSLAETRDSAVFGAFSPGLVGMVGVYRDPQRKAAHKAHIWGMFVQPAFRQSGIGDDLFSAAIRHVRGMPRVSQVHLGVSETAEPARRLYERHGFKVWGTEPCALSYREHLVAEHHMVLMLER